MPHRRAEAEASVINCSDAVLASCTVEADQIVSLYGGDPVASGSCRPGWDHSVLRPGHRPQARRALGLPSTAACCSSSAAIQPLKGPTVGDRDARRAARGRRGALPAGGPWAGPAAPRGEVAPGAARRGRRPRRARPRPLRRPPAPRAAVVVLPTRRRVHRPQPLRVVRARGARGVGLRDARGGLRRRGLTTLVDHGHTGFPGRRPRPARLRRAVRRAFAEPLAASASAPHRCLRARLYTWRPRAPSWWRCTTSWPRAASSSAAERARPETRDRPVPIVDLPRRRRCGGVARIDAWAERELAAGGFLVAARAPGGHRPHGVAPLVPALQGRREGLHHRLVHPQ